MCSLFTPHYYFSLGVSLEYYKNLKREGIPRVEILIALHDIAYDLKLLETVREERVTQRSLMRDFSYYAVKEQFHRIADGGAVLTDYDFKYILPDKDITTGENLELDFYVEGENNTPPSNIYVLIGKNGIGKTTIIKKMLKTLLCNNVLHTYGEFILSKTSTSVMGSSNILKEILTIFEKFPPHQVIFMSL